jgi:hypothetical protein
MNAQNIFKTIWKSITIIFLSIKKKKKTKKPIIGFLEEGSIYNLTKRYLTKMPISIAATTTVAINGI